MNVNSIPDARSDDVIDTEHLLTTTFLRHAEWLDETGSTNDLALQWANDSAVATPCLIGATRQSAGRGRGANRWYGSDGTLMFSVLFDMTSLGIAQHLWPQFSLVTGLSVAETLEVFLPQSVVGLKWPNDVWLDGRKVCGILIEQPDRMPGRLVAGLGWNVNTAFAAAPEEIRAIATSMRDTSGSLVDENDVLRCFLQRWEANLTQLADGSFDLAARWARFCVLRDRRIRVSATEPECTGTCLGIASDGVLLVNDGHQTRRYYAGTVRLVESQIVSPRGQ